MSKASSMTEIGCGQISRGRYWPYSSVDLRSLKSHSQRVDATLTANRYRDARDNVVEDA